MTVPLKYWMRMAVGNISAAVVVTVVFSNLTWRTPWREAVQAFGVALLFSLCIGPAVATIMPRLGRRIWCDWRFPLNWSAVGSGVLVIATAGGLLAITLLALICFLHGGSGVVAWFFVSLRGSFFVSLTVGILVRSL